MPTPLRLFLFRHGETEWSLSGQYSGRTDLSLTARGEEAARELGRRIEEISFNCVLTSPLRRARQTCKLAGLGRAAKLEPDLAEWDNGDDEGRTPAEVLRSRPGWDLFRDGSPHGESPDGISVRADNLIGRLRMFEGNVALFSHGHFGRVLAARWIGLSVAQAQRFLLNTASISILCYEHDWSGEPAIALWNSPSYEPREARRVKQRAIERWENEGGEIPKLEFAQPVSN